jgi:hypothetical protein
MLLHALANSSSEGRNSFMSITAPDVPVDDYLKALGMLVVVHSDMENWMKGLANRLTNPNETTGQILTSDLPSKPLREKLISLYLHFEKDPAKTEAFRGLIERIDKCTRERNDMVHGVWFFMPLMKKADPIRLNAAARLKGFVVENKAINLTEIASLIERIDQATQELIPIIYHWEYDHPTSAELETRNRWGEIAESTIRAKEETEPPKTP